MCQSGQFSWNHNHMNVHQSVNCCLEFSRVKQSVRFDGRDDFNLIEKSLVFPRNHWQVNEEEFISDHMFNSECIINLTAAAAPFLSTSQFISQVECNILINFIYFHSQASSWFCFSAEVPSLARTHSAVNVCPLSIYKGTLLLQMSE